MLLALFLVASLRAQTPDSAHTAVLASVHQFIDGFNKGDTKAMLAVCADQTSIIDEFPPHEWHGTGACAKWISDFDIDAKKNGITDPVVTAHDPWHVDITADRAYVVMPVNYTLKQKGKPVTEVGSVITLTLQKFQSGWRITGWAWAKH
jgi:ketosteroid isomerase-like protein